jgi:glyoxylase-like metal-dependent hydrolase (beta-lactamase superfamily II)
MGSTMHKILIVASLAASFVAQFPLGARAAEAVVQRLYVLDCGTNLGKDQARWSPGVNVGQPILFSDNCYLIRHGVQLLLWDTGLPDEIAGKPDGVETAGGAIIARRTKTLTAQLAELKVKPSDIKYLAISHSHGDHIGNLKLFPRSTVLMQQAEWDFAFADPAKSPLPAGQTVEKLNGDYDVFGDGSVMILSTPGHTPGHESLLVMLHTTGPVLLTGDAVHFKDNWDHRRVPIGNNSKEQTLASMDRLAALASDLHAQLWINHDKPQTDSLAHSPAFYE